MSSANTIVHYADSPHVGRINVLHEVLADREMMHALAALCTANLAVEDHESGRGKTYTMVSPALFEALNEGDEIPEYRIESAPPGQPFANPEWESRGKESPVGNGNGRWRFAAFRKTIVRVPQISMMLRANAIH